MHVNQSAWTLDKTKVDVEAPKESILKASECKGKVEARIHYSDGNFRFADMENMGSQSIWTPD